jgi:hypothetical protein
MSEVLEPLLWNSNHRDSVRIILNGMDLELERQSETQ